MRNGVLCLLVVVVSVFLLVSCSSEDNVLTEENAINILKKQYTNIGVKSILHIEFVSNVAVVFYESQDGLTHGLFKKQGTKWIYTGGSANIPMDTNKEETFGMNNDVPNKLLVYSGIVKTPNITRINVNQNGQEGDAKIIKGKHNLWFVIFNQLEPPQKDEPDVLKIDYYDNTNLICTEGYNYNEFSANTKSNLKQLLALKKEVDYYKNKNLKLQEEIDNLNKLNEEKPIRLSRVSGLCYIGLLDNEKVRYIDSYTELKALPFDDAPSINIIRENTLVSVTDKISNTGNYDDNTTLWYYVTIPVHDSPIDCRGWIKYNQTSIYDKEKKKTLQGEIGIRVGAKYSEASTLPDFKDNDSLPVCDYTISGRIVDQQGDYVQLECAGGKMCWVNKKDLIYPEIP